MKSLRCFDAIVSVDNIWAAWREFERGKRRRVDVASFGLDAERHVLRLGHELATGVWRPGPYTLLKVRDPKRRIVAAAPVRDRVVHHAVHRQIAPFWDQCFIGHSYACIEGRGAHRAILAFARRARQFRYMLPLDIRRYFYSIDRDRLAAILWRRLPERDLRRLLGVILASGARLYQRPEVSDWLGWEQPGEPGRGLPIGNLTSQWWGNVYLDGLDHHACRVLRVPAYQRYMDDMTVFGDDPTVLLDQREAIAAWLRDERGLELKDPDARPLSTRGALPYLGHVVRPDGIYIGRKARGRIARNIRGKLGDEDRVAQSVQSLGAVWMFGG